LEAYESSAFQDSSGLLSELASDKTLSIDVVASAAFLQKSEFDCGACDTSVVSLPDVVSDVVDDPQALTTIKTDTALMARRMFMKQLSIIEVTST
jgi:hypothetical protein